tara:strand:- start:5046 stop:5699 length:654 start_codon:yes stop_codon:yes gene_type:complete
METKISNILKSRKVLIINYGMGNIKSLHAAFRYLGIKSEESDKPDKIYNSNILILPGVGSFKKAMKNIKDKNIDEAIVSNLKKKNSSILGICLGMQLMGKTSNEDGLSKGLNLIENNVRKFSFSDTKNNKIPHVGFNNLKFNSANKLFKGIKKSHDFYFNHSYRMLIEKFKGDYSFTVYGQKFLSSFAKDNIFGTQFHPEKSQSNGLKVLENFINHT